MQTDKSPGGRGDIDAPTLEAKYPTRDAFIPSPARLCNVNITQIAIAHMAATSDYVINIHRTKLCQTDDPENVMLLAHLMLLMAMGETS